MVIYSPVISGSLTISGSIITTGGGLPLTGSLISSGSFTSIGPTVVSGSFTVVTGSAVEFQVLDAGVKIGNLVTDSHSITGSLTISGSITTNSTITLLIISSIIIFTYNTILLTINSNFKLNDRYNSFRATKIKFNALLHRIESDKNKKLNDPSYIINVDDIINSFDSLYNDLSYQFPSHIKNKVIKKYGNKKKLPNSLQIECETPSATANVDIVSFN
jgi:hypothetical protein